MNSSLQHAARADADTPAPSTIDAADVARFSAQAALWWDESGPFKPLHQLNPTRIGYIRSQICRHFGQENLAGLRLLDIGCGGGLISEPMARLGAQVTGVDASEKNIGTARHHADAMGLAIDYRSGTAEGLAEAGEQYDVVLALEIVEHVADVALFTRSLGQLVRPGGMLVLSTLNRTLKSFALAIVGAEYVLRWLPRGTHDWKQFLTPAEVTRYLHDAGLSVRDITGMRMHPLTFEWTLDTRHAPVNYLVCATRG